MRKADYLTLCDIFKRQRGAALQMAANMRALAEHQSAAFNEGKAAALELAADCFARECRTVNRAAFLELCGMIDKPHAPPG